jgi:hypothetical protein
MHRRIAIVTPVLDDWPSFSTLIERLAGAFAGIDCSLHVLAVDDGSASVPSASSIRLPRDSAVAEVSVLRLAVNLGHQRAIAVGLSRIAKRDDIDAVVVMDSDGEDLPEDVMRLCAANESHPNAVIFAGRASRAESRVFRAGYRAYKFLFRLLTGRSINFGNFSFLPMPVIRRLVFMPELWNNLPAAVVRSRIPYVTIPMRRGTRYAGKSKMNLQALILHGMSAMSVYTDVAFARVLIAAVLVAALSVFGMLVLIVIKMFALFGIPGWASAMFADLVIVLMQTLVIVVATSLVVLGGRSQRPIIPAVDAPTFVFSEGRLDTSPDRQAESEAADSRSSGVPVLRG